jgi:sterol desaturase/sphingolipid hydroxylase (fatty acid hydroxylase superfamily)
VTEAELQAIRGVTFVAAMALALLVQRLSPHARLRGSAAVNATLALVGAAIVGAACGACAFEAAGWAARERFGLLNQAGVGPWVSVPATIATLDLVSYGWHRANHRMRLLWRLHQVHHSDPAFTVSTGLRFHPGELLLALPVRLVAIVLVGAPVVAVLAFEVVFTVANLLEHGDIDVPGRVEAPIARVFVTPALHRRHHAILRPDRDRNFGTIFALWDRLFGTYLPNDSATRVDTGLAGVAGPTALGALAMPFGRPVA